MKLATRSPRVEEIRTRIAEVMALILVVILVLGGIIDRNASAKTELRVATKTTPTLNILCFPHGTSVAELQAAYDFNDTEEFGSDERFDKATGELYELELHTCSVPLRQRMSRLLMIMPLALLAPLAWLLAVLRSHSTTKSPVQRRTKTMRTRKLYMRKLHARKMARRQTHDPIGAEKVLAARVTETPVDTGRPTTVTRTPAAVSTRDTSVGVSSLNVKTTVVETAPAMAPTKTLTTDAVRPAVAVAAPSTKPAPQATAAAPPSNIKVPEEDKFTIASTVKTISQQILSPRKLVGSSKPKARLLSPKDIERRKESSERKRRKQTVAAKAERRAREPQVTPKAAEQLAFMTAAAMLSLSAASAGDESEDEYYGWDASVETGVFTFDV